MIDPLRNFDEFQKSLRNFHGWLDGVVSGASDLDLFIERKGKFFVAELKPWTNGVTLSWGQHLALSALSRQPNFSVLLIGEGGTEVGTPSETPSVPGPPVLDQGSEQTTPPTLYVLDFRTTLEGGPPIAHKKGGPLQAWFEPRRFRVHTVAELQDRVRAWWAAASIRD